MIKRNKILLLSVMSMVLFFSGCVSERPEQNVSQEESMPPLVTEVIVSEEIASLSPQFGGTMDISMKMPTTFNPILNEDITVDAVLKLIFLPIMNLDQTQKPQPNPALIESVNFSEDSGSAVIKIKSGKIWSDGTAITSQDLIYTLETLESAKETAVYKESIKNILSYDVIDELSVNINFSAAYAGERYFLRFPIIPKHYYSGESDGYKKKMQPLGNGPYIYSEYIPAEILKLVSSSNSLTGKPYIDNINAVIVRNEDTDTYAFEQGIIDVLPRDVFDWGKYFASSEYNIAENVSTYYDYIGFNFNNQSLSEKYVREAIAHAVPQEKLLEDVYVNYAMGTNSPVNPQSWLYEPDVKIREFSLETAKEILLSNGWNASGENGALIKKVMEIDETETQLGLIFRILVNNENETRMKIAEIVKENLDEIGFQTQIESLDYEQYAIKLRERDYDIVIGGYILSIAPEFSFMLNSANAITGTNYFDYKSAAMDLLLEKAFQANGEENYKKAMSELQKHIAEQLPCISIAFRKSAVILNGKIHGQIEPSLDNTYVNIEKWFISDKK